MVDSGSEQKKPDDNQETRESRFDSTDIIRTSFYLRLENLDDSLETREVRFDPIGRIKTSLYSSAIEDDILQEMGFEPGFELEKLVDQPECLVNFFTYNNRDHYCSVHKAVIPIASMRVLLDQHDIEDTVSFRCPGCV